MVRGRADDAIQTAHPRRRWSLVWTLVPACAVVTALFVLWPSSAPLADLRATPIFASGELGGLDRSESGRLSAPADRAVRYRIDDAFDISLLPSTRAALRRANTAVELELEAGAVAISYVHPQVALQVSVGATRVTAFGAVFSAAWVGDAMEVGVASGSVQIVRGDAVFDLHEGAVRSDASGVHPVAMSDELRGALLHHEATRLPPLTCPCGWVEVADTGSAPVRIGATHLGHGPLAFLWPVGDVTLELGAETRQVIVRADTTVQVTSPVTKLAPPAGPPPPRLTPAPPVLPPAKLDASALYAAAKAALTAGELSRAEELLMEARQLDSRAPLGLAAQYELAVVARDRRHDPVRAHAAFLAYLSLAPDGPLWREATLGECGTAAAVAAARACYDGLIARADAGWARFDAELERARLDEREGAHDTALVRYSQLMSSSLTPVRVVEDAFLGKSRCFAASGKAAQARQALLEYLDRFPDGRYAPAARRQLEGRL